MDNNLDALQILAYEMEKEIEKDTISTCNLPENHQNSMVKNDNIFFDTNSQVKIYDSKFKKYELDIKAKEYELLLIHSLKNRDAIQTLVSNSLMRVCIPGVVSRTFAHVTNAKKPYTRWELTGLQPTFENFTICCFLFDKCHESYCKIPTGTLIYIIGPKVDASDDLRIKIIPKSPDNILVVGQASDFGICEAVAAKTSKRCTRLINKLNGHNCELHSFVELKTQKSNRVELSSSHGKPLLKLSSDSNYQEIKPYNSLYPTLKNSAFVTKGISWDEFEKPTKSLRDYIQVPTPGTKNLLKQISLEKESKKTSTCKVNKVSDFLKKNFELSAKRKYSQTVVKNILKKSNYNFEITGLTIDSNTKINKIPIDCNHSHVQTSASCNTCENNEENRKFASQFLEIPQKNDVKCMDKIELIADEEVIMMCCKTCKYKNEQIRPECQNNNHIIIKLKAIKRFFKCEKCNYHTSAFTPIYMESCPKCGNDTFTRTHHIATDNFNL